MLFSIESDRWRPPSDDGVELQQVVTEKREQDAWTESPRVEIPLTWSFSFFLKKKTKNTHTLTLALADECSLSKGFFELQGL